MKSVLKDSYVAINYTGRLDNGEIFDSSEDHGPLKFCMGNNSVIEGLEEGLIGMTLGEKRDIRIEAEKAYGAREEDQVITVERKELPEKMKPEVGMVIDLQTEAGERFPGTISKVTAKNVTIDLNHPLAGQVLSFAVEVVDIRAEGDEGTDEWEEHGHDCCGGHGDEGCGSCGSDEDDSDSEEGGCGSDKGGGGCCGGHH